MSVSSSDSDSERSDYLDTRLRHSDLTSCRRSRSQLPEKTCFRSSLDGYMGDCTQDSNRSFAHDVKSPPESVPDLSIRRASHPKTCSNKTTNTKKRSKLGPIAGSATSDQLEQRRRNKEAKSLEWNEAGDRLLDLIISRSEAMHRSRRF